MQQEFKQLPKTEVDPATDRNDLKVLSSSQNPFPSSRWRKVFKVMVPLLILGSGLALASYLHNTGPKTSKRTPVKTARLIKAQAVHATSERVILRAMGTVIPARRMQLRARVSGEIISTHGEFLEGGFFKEGEKILQIDPEDYKLAVAQKQSQVVNARYELKLEKGRQDVAKREWQLLNGDKTASALDIELALRKPHLEKAQADLAASEAELEQAQLNLDRTTVRAPFNAIVLTRHVEKGSQISIQDQLAELAGTDEYWIQVSLPVDRLEWITIPLKPGDFGSKVHIFYGNSSQRTGTVIKLLSDLEEEGRMARVLVSVKDPLDLKNPNKKQTPLLIGEYVRVEIEGLNLENVFRLPRTALRDNSRIWIAGDDGRLIIRNVDVLWRDMETVFLKNGLTEGEQVIVSDLAAPVEGMAVRVDRSSDDPASRTISDTQSGETNSH